MKNSFDQQNKALVPVALNHSSRLLLPLAIFLLGFAALFSANAEAKTVSETAFVQIKSYNQNLCLDVAYSRSNDGAHVLFYQCTGNPNQQWKFSKAGDGVYKIIVQHTGFCLDRTGVSLKQARCNGSKNQLWNIRRTTPRDAGSTVVQSISSAADSNSNQLCVQPIGAVTNGVADAELNPCGTFESKQQSFIVYPFTWIKSSQTNQCLDVTRSSTASGADVIFYQCNIRQPNQKWMFRKAGKQKIKVGTVDRYEIVADHSGLCLDVAPGADATLIQATCNKSASQFWSLFGVNSDDNGAPSAKQILNLGAGQCILPGYRGDGGNTKASLNRCGSSSLNEYKMFFESGFQLP